MDSLTLTDLELVFPRETGSITRMFPSELLRQYPNCSLAIATKDVLCKSVTMTDVTVQEYNDMLLVLEGKVSSLACSENTSDLLDKHGFIGRLDRMLAGPVGNYQQDLMKRLAPFHHKQVNIFICNTEQEYHHCKSALADPSVVPIQVLTIGTHLMFCSYHQGIPLLNWNGEVYPTIAESREMSLPACLTSVPGLIKNSLELCDKVKAGTYEPNIITAVTSMTFERGRRRDG